MTNASIVIPVFNRAHLVHRAIESSLAQTEPCEVIVVDHGSTDGITKVVSEYGGRIRYVRCDQDLGPIACWLDGIEHASGKYVHINFDDDWIQPTFMEEALALISPEVGFVYTRVRIHQSGEDTGIATFYLSSSASTSPGPCGRSLLRPGSPRRPASDGLEPRRMYLCMPSPKPRQAEQLEESSGSLIRTSLGRSDWWRSPRSGSSWLSTDGSRSLRHRSGRSGHPPGHRS